LKIAKEGAKDRSKIDLILADARHLPFRDLSVDIVLCSEVLEHLYDPLQALSELLRIFRNTLLLTVPVETISKKIAKILGYSNRLRKIESDIGHVSMHNSRWWRSAIYQIIETKKAKWRVNVDHSYLSAEPFTRIFSHLRNETLFRATDKTLEIIEKILAHPIFANHLMITLTV
jgi:ubiquinone/menaquinone biosynthesis C-methylase UbiE